MKLIKQTNIQFVKSRYIAYAFSLILIIAGIVGIAVRGLNWSIDFSSGVATQVNLKALDQNVPDVTVDKLRSVLKSKFPEAQIQYVGDEDQKHRQN